MNLEVSWKILVSTEKFCAFEAAAVIKDSGRLPLTLNALAFASYCQNPEIFICLCSVNYHSLIIYSNLYQFHLLIEIRKRSLLCCACCQFEQLKKRCSGKNRKEELFCIKLEAERNLKGLWEKWELRHRAGFFQQINLGTETELGSSSDRLDRKSELPHCWFLCQLFLCVQEAQTKMGEGKDGSNAYPLVGMQWPKGSTPKSPVEKKHFKLKSIWRLLGMEKNSDNVLLLRKYCACYRI